ncbi:MAG: NYN domain-containing protein [Ruminiclostridium sp.]|nr:NYN domain-containing protein [Ruminiclostridium sp.]
MGKNKNEINNYFFVDYENVKNDCLTGLEMLGKTDKVRIYYGKAAAHIPFETHLRIVSCSAEFEYIKVEFPIKNALDCMILYDIGNMSAGLRVGCYFIVSKDSDFDEPINILREKGVNIRKITEIKEFREDAAPGKKAPEEKKKSSKTKAAQSEKAAAPAKKQSKTEKSVAEALSGTPYSQQSDYIARSIAAAPNRIALNNVLQTKYEGKQTKELFKLLKNILADMPSH